ncbi:MAG: 1-deoxy-D-xylulose-5-phosphate synthase [Roseburia sp.]|nr:1-deoxy-D-xylulose-5-phosphate synthase [Roseburia sp.]
MDVKDIKSPLDIKRLDISELGAVADSIREKIISTVENNGGHLSSNLGAVELTVALHYVFNSPVDKIIFDVGHQSYAHKLLTGRADKFDGLRRVGGISGFPQPNESEHDAFGTGHASTALSVALGFAEAARQKGESYRTVAVVGDGALTGGMAYEALNAIGSDGLPVIIVLNDNEMSISKNVGAMSKYLTRLRGSRRYARMKNEIKRAVSIIPIFGDGIKSLMDKGKKFLKRLVLSNKIFESMGISYYGPFDGHDIGEMIDVFTHVKAKAGPVIVHVITDKGHGLPSAKTDPEHSHGIAALGGEDDAEQFSDALGEFFEDVAPRDDRVMVVTAAMSIGTGLENFSKTRPDRFKDVGIAEEHAVTYCAALAAAGMKPYFAVYSTFLQRSFDQLLHDVCIGGYPVTLCIDRAGVVGADGATHQGIFDLSYLLLMPSMTVMCPTDGEELKSMLEFSLGFDAPLAIRYPKSYGKVRSHSPIEYGKWEVVKASNSKTYVLCAGSRALDIAESASEKADINIVNCRFVKPLDLEFLRTVNKKGNHIVTVEDNIERGGFGQSVLAALNGLDMKAKCTVIAHGDAFIDERDVALSLEASGITQENLIKVVKNLE